MRIEFLNCSAKNRTGYTTLNGINLTLRKGSFNIVSGDDKSGKSLLLYLAYGLIKSTEGMVLVDKQPLKNFNRKRLNSHQRDTALITKNPELIDRLDVFDNVSLPLRLRGVSQAVINHKVRAALKELDIKHLEFASPRNLSTGVRQRICIARFIALRPKVLLINDVYLHLNSKEKQMIDRLLVGVNEASATILLVTDITRIHRIKGARFLTLWRGELSPS